MEALGLMKVRGRCRVGVRGRARVWGRARAKGSVGPDEGLADLQLEYLVGVGRVGRLQ